MLAARKKKNTTQKLSGSFCSKANTAKEGLVRMPALISVSPRVCVREGWCVTVCVFVMREGRCVTVCVFVRE